MQGIDLIVAAQVKSPVKWQKTVENLAQQGADSFIEVGVGKTLTGLIRKIDSELKAVNIETKEGLDALE